MVQSISARVLSLVESYSKNKLKKKSVHSSFRIAFTQYVKIVRFCCQKTVHDNKWHEIKNQVRFNFGCLLLKHLFCLQNN